jgi:hypothetical protein
MKDVQEHLRHARIETTGNVYVQSDSRERAQHGGGGHSRRIESWARKHGSELNTSEHDCDGRKLEVIENMVAPA